MLNCRGPKQGRRLLLQTVCSATMLHAAPLWADAAKTMSYTKGLNSTYRLCALRVCSGYRTISDDAALVIAGSVPIDLFAAERQELYQALIALSEQTPAATHRLLKESSRATSIQKRQQRWDESTKGRWTHQQSPTLRIGSKEVNFWLTQVISGHGVTFTNLDTMTTQGALNAV
ncbi:hypothetical protein KR074_005620 [Drosophila pseudoananassae]|nr:hypothetical protein KR074_005620 [Drosophila pseudoananassae]